MQPEQSSQPRNGEILAFPRRHTEMSQRLAAVVYRFINQTRPRTSCIQVFSVGRDTLSCIYGLPPVYGCATSVWAGCATNGGFWRTPSYHLTINRTQKQYLSSTTYVIDTLF